jgi:solute carrier family 25 S-adenosylmethionine transporter 26
VILRAIFVLLFIFQKKIKIDMATESIRFNLSTDNHNYKLNDQMIHFLAGGFGLATAFAIMHPLDTLKTQLQTNSINLKQLTRGFYVSFLLAFPQGGLRLSTMEYTKSHLKTKLDYNIASALAAICGDTASSVVKVPREVITQRLQSGMDPTKNTLKTIKLIINEQGPMGLFRGFWSTTARDWPFMVILFTTYDAFKNSHSVKINQGRKDFIEISKLSSTFFGGVSGFLAGFFTTPFDVIKTKIMTTKGSANAFTVARLVYKDVGPRGFFVGAGARSVWWFGVCSMFFPIYEFTKEKLGETKE